MNNKIHFLTFFILFSCQVYGQSVDTGNPGHAEIKGFKKKNSVNLEAFGHGVWYSLNYERILINKNPYKLSVQAGLAAYPHFFSVYNYFGAVLPVSLNFLKSFSPQHQHHLELGVGHSFWYSYDFRSKTTWNSKFLTFKAGYRYQKPDGRLVLKFLFSPLLEYGIRYSYNKTGMQFHPWGSISVGYAF